MDSSKSEKKHKVAMDNDVSSLFGSHDDNFPVYQREGTRLEGTGGQTRLLGGTEERKALKTIFINLNKFQLIRLPGVPNEEITTEIKQKMAEISNYFEDDELEQTERQLLAEAENAKINILLTFKPTLVEQGKKLGSKGVLKVEIMQPSVYVRNYL
ncbi:MAG: hypothetical protein ACLP2P_11725 [Desulfobaccales bacterium]